MMVVTQIAASMILLVSAALLVRSFAKLQNEALGMRTHGVLTASISLNSEKYATPQSQMDFFTRAERELHRLPGVSLVALSDTIPPGGYHHDQIYSNIAVEGRPAPTGETGGMVTWRWVTPEYFNALDIPIVRGTGFNDAQQSSTDHFIILSSLLAERLFPGLEPIGQRVKPAPNDPWYTVEGVAADVKNAGLDALDQPEFYRLRRNVPDDWQQAPSAVFILKTSTAPKALAPWVRSQIAQVDSAVPIEIETLNERVSGLADRPRFETALLTFFAFTGLVMAIIGLYGVVAFMAAQRTQEIGIRMALGATRADVMRLILREGFRLIAIGGAIGLAAALALSRVLQTVLFGVSPHDPISFGAVTVLLALVALIAILIPARSAMKTDPMTALRCE
jgi:predicted permease